MLKLQKRGLRAKNMLLNGTNDARTGHFCYFEFYKKNARDKFAFFSAYSLFKDSAFVSW